MTKENKKKIFELLSEVTGHTADLLAALHGDTPIRDFGLSSIAFIRFVVALEDEFGIEVLDSDLDFGKFSTVNALFGTLEKYFSKNTLKKVLVCDCDNVLWRGISGEEPTVIDAAADAVQNEPAQTVQRRRAALHLQPESAGEHLRRVPSARHDTEERAHPDLKGERKR